MTAGPALDRAIGAGLMAALAVVACILGWSLLIVGLALLAAAALVGGGRERP